MRLIDADNLTAFLGDERATLHKEQQTFRAMSEIEFNARDYMLSNFQFIIDNAPTVDFTFEETFQKTICENRLYCPARPTGEWKITEAYPHKVYCDKCYKTYAQENWEVWKDGSLPRDFCPNCGAKMKGAEE